MAKSSQNNLTSEQKFVDQFGNVFFATEELARGGQGVVYRTTDPDVAIKQPLDSDGNPDEKSDLMSKFQNIRFLPLPNGIPVTLPLSIMSSSPGYSMKLLNGMKPLGALHIDGKSEKELMARELPQWLSGIPDKKMAMKLFHYALTGGARKRYEALYKGAAVLARLHDAGLVYGDVSLNNIFIGRDENPPVWLIDADNLRFERISGGGATYTPRLGAPEIVQGKDSSRPRTDCWAFAVMAFEMLTLTHPFIGKLVSGEDGEGDDWDAEPSDEASGMGMEDQAFSGLLPYIDDEDDDSNEAPDLGLPRVLVLTSGLKRLFQETFGAGRTMPFRRPAMKFWALELARALDRSLCCPSCGMSYFPDEQEECPFCGAPHPVFCTAVTARWQKIFQESEGGKFVLPHRAIKPFSLKNGNDCICELVIDFKKKNGYLIGVRFAEKMGFYRQNYCGCEFSRRAGTINRGETNDQH